MAIFQRCKGDGFVLRLLVALAVAIGGLAAFQPRPVSATGLLIADGGLGGILKIKEQNVRVTINNGIAVTEINQVFVNTENRIVEALYTFPVPKGGSVSNFSMIINGKEMIGEVVEKKRARQIYESYKRTRRDPGLLEQVDYKRFEMRVFPIAAAAEQHIKVTYYQQLDFDHDWATYVYPLATSTRGVDETTTGKFALTVDVNSEIPITQLESPSHDGQFVVVNHSPNYVRASLETTEGDLSKDVVLAFQTSRPRTGLDMIASRQAGQDGYFLMTLTAGKELEGNVNGMDYVFVLDISGSMANQGKLGLSQNAARAFMKSLGPKDRFEVMTFNNRPNLNFQSLHDATAMAIEDAEQFLDSQRAVGGTELRPALAAAFRYKDPDRPLNVVILSDGMTEAKGQQQLLAATKTAAPGTRVFCVGIGNEVNRPLLTQVAERAGGLSAFISTGDNFERQAESFRRKLVHPVATELDIKIDGVQVYDVLPGKPGNLFHGSPIRLIGRYKMAGTSAVTITGNIQGKPFQQTVDIEFPETNADNPQIERMWAYSKVRQLTDQVRRTGETDDLTEQIVQLCEGYSIVSEYASFIVLENDAEYRRWRIQRRNATRIQRDRQARQKVAADLQSLRDESIANLGPVNTQQTVSHQMTTDAPSSGQAPANPGDLDFSVPSNPGRSGGGGGAIDPITALIGAGLAGSAAWRRRRSRAIANESEQT